MNIAHDWPASLAASAIREDFLARLGFREGLDYKQQPDYQNPSAELLDTLSAFHRALANLAASPGPARSRLEEWLSSFSNSKDTLEPFEAVMAWRETQVPSEKWASSPFPITDAKKLQHLGNLFQRLLGMAVMRPVVDVTTGSSIFYAAIDRPGLAESTKDLILDSVVVPPGRGSVGLCLRQRASETPYRCVGISFADYAGVVEWQDLVQGQASILMVVGQGYSEAQMPTNYDDQQESPGPQLSLVFMAFTPVPFLFNDLQPVSASPLIVDSPAPGAIHSLDEVSNPSRLFLDALRNTVSPDSVRDRVAAQTEFQDLRRRNNLLTGALGRSEDTDFAEGIVRLLIPDHFTDLPVPISSAFALVRDLEHDKSHVVHIRATTETLQDAVAKAAGRILEPEPDLPITMPAQLRWPVDYIANSKEWIFRLTDPEETKVEATWWLHVKDDVQAPNAAIGKWLKRIHTPLHHILRTRDRLTDPEFLKTLDPELRQTLQIFGEWKLRDNVAHSYYPLVCRALLERIHELREERVKEFRYILCACTGFEERNQTETSAAITDACRALSEIPEQLNNICGASATVRTNDLVLDSESLELDEAQRASLARLLQMIRVQNALYGHAAPEGIRLEESPDLWGKQLSGKLLRIESWGPKEVQATLGDTTFIGRIKDSSDTRTAIRADICKEWLKPLLSMVEESSAENTQRELGETLGVSFELLRSSEAVHKTASDKTASAQVFIAFPRSTDLAAATMVEVKDRYQKKLEPIASLFAARLKERFARDEQIAGVKKEESRAVVAEQLISGTAHSLKIPMTVALGALRNDPDKAEWFLTRGMSLVTIGGFIQNRERLIREAKDPKQVREALKTYWVPVSVDADEGHSLILDKTKLREYFDAACYYVRACNSGGPGYDQAPTIKAMTLLEEDDSRLSLSSRGRYRLMQTNNPVNEDRAGESAAVFAVFLELLTNSLKYVNREDPRLSVSVCESRNSEGELRLKITFENTALRNLDWSDSGTFMKFLDREKGVTGIRTAYWAIKNGLDWGFDPTPPERVGAGSQVMRIVIDAPLKGERDASSPLG